MLGGESPAHEEGQQEAGGPPPVLEGSPYHTWGTLGPFILGWFAPFVES